MIHPIQSETIVRHHGHATARIVERYQQRRDAVNRMRRELRTNVTASA
jgi:hypothetical protein